SGGHGHVGETSSADVLEHSVRHEHGVIRIARAQVEVQETVIIQIEEIGTHRSQGHVQSGGSGHILEACPLDIVIKTARLDFKRLAEQALDDVVQRAVVAADE